MASQQTNHASGWDDFSGVVQFEGNGLAGLEPESQIAAGDFDALPDWDDEFDSNATDDSDWDEPELTAEYDSELRQPLYVIEDDDPALAGELRIDQWVAVKLGAFTSTQRGEIAELLRDLNPNRLRRWLPWLGQQEWTGDSLLLFLRFRELWDSTSHWWECTFWDHRAKCWYPTRNRYSLTLNDAYDLVMSRLGFRPREVIDEAWLGDWIEMKLWQHGFLSFASFAAFRARFGRGESWMRQVEWYVQDVSDSSDAGTSRRANGYQLHRYGPPLWFAEQDWYDPSDWHDNLGW